MPSHSTVININNQENKYLSQTFSHLNLKVPNILSSVPFSKWFQHKDIFLHILFGALKKILNSYTQCTESYDGTITHALTFGKNAQQWNTSGED